MSVSPNEGDCVVGFCPDEIKELKTNFEDFIGIATETQ